MSEKKKPLKIVELKAENVKRLKAVCIRPDGHVVVIGGRNAQGKSSTLDAIAYALGGKKLLPAKPVRDGEEKATMSVDLGDLIVTRTITAAGGGSLKVTTQGGLRHTSPQKVLDDLTGAQTGLAFDPLAFLLQDDKKQLQTLKSLVGLDFTELDARRKASFDERTMVNRAAKEASALCERLPLYNEAPAEEVSIAALSAEIEAALETQRAADDAQIRQLDICRHRDQKTAALASAGAALREAQRRIKELDTDITALTVEADDAKKAAEEAAAAVIDPAPIRAQIEAADETNRQVRANSAWHVAEADMQGRESQSARLTADIQALDDEKRDALEAASFPVDGLSFDESGLTYDGIPFGQSSQAQKLRVSMAISFSLNPRLKIALIRDASLLDEDSLRLVAELAAEHDAQVWLERVGTGDEVSVVIEDGEVVE